jgi:hypothetical protein
MWRRAAIYGALLAAGTLGLQWLATTGRSRSSSGDNGSRLRLSEPSSRSTVFLSAAPMMDWSDDLQRSL